MTEDEYKNISQVNRDIAHRYIRSIENDSEPKADNTVLYNVRIMKFILENLKTDLSNLTIDDIDDFKVAINIWRKKNGKPVSSTTKKAFFVGLKRFLHWYGERYDNPKYLNLIKQIKVGKVEFSKLPSDLLTVEEIEKMIMTARTQRDKALIATLAESGCRASELLACRIKDVKMCERSCDLTFPKGKTGSRTVTLVFASSYIDHYLRWHPFRDNEDAPLWITERRNEYRKISYNAADKMVKAVAIEASITKRVHLHLFRHTAATQLAKVWTEPMMRTFLGWQKDSAMPSVYIHLSSEDMKTAVLADRYGLIERRKNDKGFEVGTCPKCRVTVPTNATFCYSCGMPLTQEAQKTINATTTEFTVFINQYPELIKQFMNQLQANLPK